MTIPAEKLAQERERVNIMQLSGRVSETWRHDGVWYAVVLLPAPSSFDKPGAVKVRSRSEIGRAGEDVEFRVRPSGFARKVPIKNGPRAGESFTEVNVWFDVD